VNVLVVSHSCVVDTNQRIYGELGRLAERVDVLVPDRWYHEHTRGRLHPTQSSKFGGRLLPVPVFRPGSVQLHAYVTAATRMLRRLRPDILYIEEEPYSLAAVQWATAARRAGIPALFYNLQNIPKRYPPPVRLWERWVWNSTAGALCASENVRQVLGWRGFKGRSWIVPLSVDVSDFRPMPKDQALRERLALRGRVLTYLGRLVPEKGVRVALEAYRRLEDRNDISLLCIGGGPLAAELREQEGVVVLDNTRHADVQSILPLSDLLLLPSLTTPRWKEQFGRAAVEAMASGVPVIGSDSGEIPVILNATGGGVVVRENDPVALRQAISRLLSDPKALQNMGSRGRDSVTERFSTRAVAKAMHGAFQEALSLC
jgi:glycosyltransferase involved in cell wall biosynthesis